MQIVADLPKKNPTSKAKFTDKKNYFFVRRLYTLYKQKLSNLRPLLAFTFPKGFRKSKKLSHWTSRSGGKKTFKMCEQIKIYPWKPCNRRGDLSPLKAKVSNLRPLLFITFPQGFQKFKSLDVGLEEVGTKRRLNGANKWRKNVLKKTFSPWQFYTCY